MAIPVGSYLDRQQIRIQEVLGKTINLLLPKLEPFARNILTGPMSSMAPVDNLGRDWHIHRLFYGNYTGVIDQGRPYGDIALMGDLTSQVGPKGFFQRLTQVWPDPLEGPNQMPYKLTVPMRSQLMTIMMTLGEMSAEANPGNIGQIVTPKLMAFARNIAHYYLNGLFLSQNTQYRLCTVASPTAAVVDPRGWAHWDFTPNNLSVNRFAPGQRIDLYDPTGVVQRNIIAGARVNLIVLAVHRMQGRVTIGIQQDAVNAWQPANWAVPYNPAANAGDIVTFANTSHAAGLFTGTAGFNSYLKFGDAAGLVNTANNTILGNEAIAGGRLNVNEHPEFASFYKDVGGPLTHNYLCQVFARLHAALDPQGDEVDSAIASEGVWLEYQSHLIGRERIERSGRLASLQNEGLSPSMKFSYGGKTYNLESSTFVEGGTVYLQKLKNNWRRYVAPDPQGSGTFGQDTAGIPVRFIVPLLTGGSSIRFPITATAGAHSQITEGSVMPAWVRMQFVPDKLPGAKLVNVTEQRLYSDVL